MRKYEDLTGSWFGKIEVLNKAPSVQGGRPRWVCRCECGKIFISRADHLKSGATKSCGCMKKRPSNDIPIRDMYKNSKTLDVLETEMIDGDPYQNLANAIVAVAVDDYRSALKAGNEKLKSSLEKFFHSDWYKVLTKVDGDYLIELLRNEHAESLIAAAI